MKSYRKEELEVKIYDTREELGKGAARDIAESIKSELEKKEEINIIFAAAPSQTEVLKELVSDKGIEWGRINGYHMDEYIGLEARAPQGFGNFLKRHIFDLVGLKSVNCIDATAKDAEAEAERYGKLIKEHEADIVVMGIGENGHIAFNDPWEADFGDERTVKVVKLDEICRRQQVNDGCFGKLEEVPEYALTLTVPTLVKARHLFCVVPARRKAEAVYETLNGKIDEHCPATILRRCKGAKLYLDKESSELL